MSDLAARVDAEYRKRFLHYTPHEKQFQFHTLGATCRERLFLAGNRVGKTFCGATEGAMHLTGRYPPNWLGKRFDHPVDMWAASVTGEATRDILQNEYLGNPSKGTIGTIHPSLIISSTNRAGIAGAVDTVFVRHSSGGVSQLGFKSYDQGRAKFQGTHKHVIHPDEEPPLDIYDEMFMRTAAVGNKPQGIILMTMTPLGGMTPLVSAYTENRISGEPLDGRVFIQAGWEDNPHLSPEERTDLERRFASRPHELEARKLGIPSIGTGLIYPVEESVLVCDPFEIPDHWPRCFGMDFGWTNPTAAAFIAHDLDSDIAYVYAEYAATELSPQTHVANLRAMGADWIPGTADPAGQSAGQSDGEALLEKYADHGLVLEPADNSVESGIQTVLERMLTGRLRIFRTCPRILAERRMYAREKYGDDKVRVKKVNDHLMDANRYGIVSGLGIAKTKKQVELSKRRGSSASVSGWAA